MTRSITETGTEMRSYYGRPILKEPVWQPEIPFYFFTGGIAGGCSVLHGIARLARQERLAKTALYVGAAADAVSPILLISDLGRPERFLNMLRVFKVTSPMSVGSWVLFVSGGASSTAAVLELLGKKEDGRVWKCTLCYDRLKGGHEPACAKACPTDSIQFGEVDELRGRAHERLEKLQAEGWNGAQLYLDDPDDGIGGAGAFFLLLDEPEVYGLPPDPVVTTKHLSEMWTTTAIAAAATVVGAALAFLGGRK